MSGINYAVLLCCIHMALVVPVFVLALWVIMRVDRTPQLEFTCDGTDRGNKHTFDPWKPMNFMVNTQDKVIRVTQVRKCKRCGYTQLRKTRA